MSTELIIIEDFCRNSNIDRQFIVVLEQEGLIEIQYIDNQQYIEAEQLKNIERYARWYYDLSINIEGIDVIQSLLKKIETMQEELNDLHRMIDTGLNKESFDFDNDLFN